MSADSLSLTGSNTQPNQVSLKAPAGCAWTLAPDTAASSIVNTRLQSGGGYTPSQLKAGIINANRLSGSGDAIIELRANVNATANTNTGQITATATGAAPGRANRTATLTVVQAATPRTDTGCSTLRLNRESEWQGDNIISGTVSVFAATNNCTWTAISDAPWLIIMQGASSKGTGTVQYQIQANTIGSEQQGTITVKGSAGSTPVALTINQAASTTNVVSSGGSEGGSGDGGGDGGSGGGSGGDGGSAGGE